MSEIMAIVYDPNENWPKQLLVGFHALPRAGDLFEVITGWHEHDNRKATTYVVKHVVHGAQEIDMDRHGYQVGVPEFPRVLLERADT